MKITESRLRSIIRQVIKESYGEEKLRDEKDFFTDLFIHQLDEDTFRDELVTVGHHISDRLDLRQDAYAAKLLRNDINAFWSRDERGECGFLLVKAEPYRVNRAEPDYFAIVRVELDDYRDMFYYEIIKISENIREVLVEFKNLMNPSEQL